MLFSYPLSNQLLVQASTFNHSPVLKSHHLTKPLPLNHGYICGMKDSTTVSAYCLLPFTPQPEFHTLIVQYITKELLAGFEGPLWRAIRGKGLSYDFGMYFIIV